MVDFMRTDSVLEHRLPGKRVADFPREDDLRRASREAIVVITNRSIIDLGVRHDCPRPKIDLHRIDVTLAAVTVRP
jgi:hypothetical protein